MSESNWDRVIEVIKKNDDVQVYISESDYYFNYVLENGYIGLYDSDRKIIDYQREYKQG